MNEYIKLARNALIMIVLYFTLIYLAEIFIIKPMGISTLFNSTMVIIGIIIPFGMLGAAIGKKIRGK